MTRSSKSTNMVSNATRDLLVQIAQTLPDEVYLGVGRLPACRAPK